MIEVDVLDDGQTVLVQRHKGEREKYKVSIVELRHNEKRIGTIWDALLYVQEVLIVKEKAPDGSYERIAILKI